MQKENRKKDKEERKNELYAGGRAKGLVWIAYIEELIFNKPIQNALWNNEVQSIKALNEPPEWKVSSSSKDQPNRWKKVVKFGNKWFPHEFGQQDPRKQKSVATQFQYLFKKAQSEWYQELKDTVKGQAYTEIRKLGPEKVWNHLTPVQMH